MAEVLRSENVGVGELRERLRSAFVIARADRHDAGFATAGGYSIERTCGDLRSGTLMISAKPLGALIASLLWTAPVAAQRMAIDRPPREPVVSNIPYDGRFTFARLRFTNLPGGYYYRGLPAWAHGYPTAERNLMKIMREVSVLDAHVEESNAISVGDTALFHYPVAYATEASFLTLTEPEVASLRAYFMKGGFVIFDDFREYFNGAGWNNFATQIRRVLPGAQFVDLDPKLAIFHSFYDIDSFDVVPQYYDRGRPAFRGVYLDNDPKQRLLMMINFNTDVSNFWEFSATGFMPVEESNEAYTLGVNYIIYALTH